MTEIGAYLGKSRGACQDLEVKYVASAPEPRGPLGMYSGRLEGEESRRDAISCKEGETGGWRGGEEAGGDEGVRPKIC